MIRYLSRSMSFDAFPDRRRSASGRLGGCLAAIHFDRNVESQCAELAADTAQHNAGATRTTAPPGERRFACC